MSSLADTIATVALRASRDGSLVSLPTSTSLVVDGGIEFIVHVSELQKSKAVAKKLQKATSFNPFLPPDPDLLIGPVPPRHVAVLNKFNVLHHHLLIVTDEFEAQERLLHRGDFEALGRCMAELDGLGFYNGGTVAGASQPHKHLQLAPLPLGSGPDPTPLDRIVPPAGRVGEIDALEALPFRHAFLHLDGRAVTGNRADELHEHYRAACAAVGIRDETQPYNMLLTRRWMLVAPRRCEHWEGVSINSLGFAGSLLVRNRDQLAAVKRRGPLSILRTVVEAAP
ncbi:MAG: hypothetical protein V2I67_11495 [Thermoanaerobaculales bacterium]|nr:hypothetical protein [Thermoanaerobaculales bacterium]